jgi:hypothetical protein
MAVGTGAQLTSADLWLDDELAGLRVGHPRLARAAGVLVRHRVAVIVCACSLAGALTATLTDFNDMHLFVRSAHILFSTHGLNVFEDPTLQVGAGYLILVEAFTKVGALVGLPAATAATAGMAALVGWLALRVAALIRPLPGRLAVLRDVGVGAALMLGPLATAAMYGHLEEMIIPVGVIAAAEFASRRRDVAAGSVLGLCVSLKLWGLLGVPVLLIAATPRALWRRGLAFAAVTAVAYGPFFVFGRVETFRYHWLVNAESPLGLLDPGGVFGWRMRLVQTVVCCLLGLLLVRRRADPWVIVSGIVAVRLLLDPGREFYYDTALVVCLLLGLWSRYAWRWATLGPTLVVAALLTTAGGYLAPGGVATDWARDLLLLAVLVAVLRLSGRRPPVASRP